MDQDISKEDSKSSKPVSGGLLNRKLNRRNFLRITERVAGLLAVFGPFSLFSKDYSQKPNRSARISSRPDYPFKLGVASGDPLPDGVVLWTRLASDPLIKGGGISPEPVEVIWEISKDKSFRHVIKNGTETADPSYAHAVHAEVEGLDPDQWYYYRFKLGSEVSPTGRTKTAPALDADYDQLNFAFLSCHSYTSGFYTAYEHLIKEDLDVVFFLGDYIYEGGGEKHIPNKTIFSLDEYRIRYGQYKSDPALQAAHAAVPWIVTPDDHELKNDWAGDAPSFNSEKFLARRSAAFQAYYENMPLRKSSMPDDINMQLYRNVKYGNLVEFNVLDTRQYRTNLACGGKLADAQCEERFKTSATMLGEEQENWLINGLKSSSAEWNVLAQQVMVAQCDRADGEEVRLHMDKWDGYVATRNKLFNCVKENGINNLVVLTGDQHSNWVNDLKEDFNDPESRTLGTEFVGTSVTSFGNGSDFPNQGKIALAENQHIKFMNGQRGYVRCSLTKNSWRTDFRVLPYVDKPGAPISTRASFILNNKKPGAVKL